MASKSTAGSHALRNAFHATRSTFLNPIIIKEMRGQMRGSRAFWILTGYLLALGLLAYGLYRITVANANNRFGPGSFPQSAFIGETLFIGLAFLELVFVCLITPALTAGAISGEDERRTYELLLATPLRPASILWGKMVASLTYVQLLILAAIPLFSVVFLFGGVALRDAVQTIGLLVLVAITYGTLGLFFSALTRRTGRATVLSYLIVLTLIFGSAFAWMVAGALGGRAPPREMLYLNPISAMASAILTPEALEGVYGMGPIVVLLLMMSGGTDVLGLAAASTPGRPVWQYTVALYLVATVILYLLTTQLVKPVRRWRVGWQGLIGAVLVATLMVFGLLFVFGTDRGSTGWGAPSTPTPFFPLGVPGPNVVEQVVVERVVVEPTMVPPPPPAPTMIPAESQIPTPTPAPTPTPVPFDVSEHEAVIQDYLAGHTLPEGETVFCDLSILESTSGHVNSQVYAWAYCRAFRVVDGQLAPGLSISAPVILDLYWTPDLGWQVGGHWYGDIRDMFPPDVQQRLLEAPYDQAAGEERLQEQARQALLGE